MITLMLNREERKLVMNYGYPFEEIEEQIERAGDVDLARISDDAYWWEQVVGSLSISVVEQAAPEDVCEAIDNLASRIECELAKVNQQLRRR